MPTATMHAAALVSMFMTLVTVQGANFAGEWSQDRAKTEATNASGGVSRARGGFYAGARIVQDASKLTISSTGSMGEVLETTVYLFDGSDGHNPEARKKRLPDGMVTSSARKSSSPAQRHQLHTRPLGTARANS